MKRRSGFTVMARLIGLVRPLAGYMFLAITMGLIGHLCAAGITVLGGYALLDVLGFDTPIAVGTVFVCVLIFALVRGLFRYGEQSCNHYIAFKLLALLRDRVFRALRRLTPAKLEGRDKGDLISVITSDIELLEVFYAHTISPVVIAVVFSLLVCLFIGSFHWALGLLALAAYLVVGVVIPLVTSRLAGDTGLQFRSRSGALSAFVLDSLRGLPELLQYSCGHRRLEEMDRRTEELSGHEERLKRIAGRNTAVTGTVILLFDLLMLFSGGLLQRSGALGFDGVLLCTLALFASFGPVIAVANLGSTLQSTFAAGNRVLDILDETPVVADVTEGLDVDFDGAAAQHVTFSYGDETVLQDVSVALREHTVIGISGRSGSGKSTLLKLFMRFWDVQQGRITVSGTDIRQVNTARLRELESFVTQDTHLFHGSIRSNLLIAKPDATDAQLEEACRRAAVHDFIQSLPQGYDTPVGELGDTLSGGQRQRLGLARAFLHNAPLMLLDEPTSNLDSLNEAVILRSLHQQREGRTIVLVSHRASTMRIADTVYSVEHGRLS